MAALSLLASASPYRVAGPYADAKTADATQPKAPFRKSHCGKLSRIDEIATAHALIASHIRPSSVQIQMP
jgi:hypothetical protein